MISPVSMSKSKFISSGGISSINTSLALRALVFSIGANGFPAMSDTRDDVADR